ncbi:MAG TPA: M28 family metallopeptidase [Thermoanaerobaculia bacterium]|nr:M28 family metallopeptidase [Thermoanaerobaculia bacterium]
MRMSLLRGVLSLLIPAALCAQSVPPSVDRALRAIESESFRAHVRFLADDLLEGRGAGTRGYDLAAAWTASRFEELGLEPAGTAGSWFQPIPFVRSTLVPERSSLSVHRRRGEHSLRIFDDFTIQPNPTDARAEVRAPAVFAGFGISAPELGWDDYARTDVGGKIVVVLAGAPGRFPPTLRAHHGGSRRKAELAEAAGAVGLITVRGPLADRRSPWERTRRQAKIPSLRWIGPDGRVRGIQPGLRAIATMSRSGAEAIFEPRALARALALENDARRPLGFPLRIEISMKTATEHERIESSNVVAMLPGSDAELSREVVVYTAHLDHLGITEPVDGDPINNGAFDNASGTAAMIEAAGAFRALPSPPKRSVLFLAVTAEEKGLLGSDYFARFPTIERDRIVANVNMDMFVMIHPLREVVVFGYEHSTLARHADAAAAHLGIRRIDDPKPDEASFVRSDQYSFVRQGIPAVALNEGTDSGDPAVDGKKEIERWLLERYHTPQDDLRQPIVWEAGRDLARLGFLIGWLVAEAPDTPRWNEGDFFGRTFGR